MVLRKETPQPNLVPAPLSHASNDPPYPTTPSTEQPPALPSSSDQAEVYSPDLNSSPAFRLKTLDDARKPKDDDESDYSDEDWDKTDDEDTSPEDLPNPLKIGGGRPIPNKDALPDALRAGPPPGVAVKKASEPIAPDMTGASSSSFGSAGSVPLKTNNPYLRMQTTGQSHFGNESSEQAWGDAPAQAQSYGELVELPTMQTPITPTNGMAKLGLNSDVPSYPGPKSPNQPPLIAVESATPQSASPRHDSNASSIWASGMDVSSLDAGARSYGLPEDATQQTPPQRSWQEQQSWEQAERERRQEELAAAQAAAARAEQERKHEEEFHRAEQAAKITPAASPWDDEPSRFPPPQAVNPAPAAPSPWEHEHAPALPPRKSQEQEHAPHMPPRPIDTGVGTSSTQPSVESPNTVINRQRKEHYQIKQIRWYDANKQGIRTSPILTQNLNGPCPLLALVNALVLSTPAGVETALVETLRTREQVTLGLLIDAVFDELMSGRRGDAAMNLPDVTELYKFLVTLHTGLNVNPMYVQDPGATDGTQALIPSLVVQPGAFENTREMRLYRTFDIPLIHGWLPPAGSDAYIAFERVAKTYEDAQHVQFQEEELDAKLQTEGLNSEEQRMFTDIHAIKEFLNRWPTQLTDYGLKTMRESIRPGQIGILFRNDHFSTLYKDPRTDNLVTLVTDAGYSTHDEIVWESLVDVNGQGSELYSGDFRPVGGDHAGSARQQQPVQSLLDIGDNQGWTTVQSRRNNRQASPSTSALSPTAQETPLSPSSDLSKAEQEDHDLALALQLQEEEEDRHRRSVEERRRREDQLSESAIASQSQSRPNNRRAAGRSGENPPLIPPRRNNVQTHRPANSSEPAPPPTYEEAATTPQYHPPQGHPANPGAPFLPGGSAYNANSAGMPGPGPGSTGRRRSSRPMGEVPLPARPGRRQSAGVPGGAQEERGDKCVVM